MPLVAIFGASQTTQGSFEYDTAEYVGKVLSSKGFDIATGGYLGVMEAALKGASDKNVRRIGITTDYYTDKAKNDFVSEEIRMPDYFSRFMKLATMGDAYIVLPGGTGTLAELAAIWAFKSRGLLPEKPFVCIGEQWNEVVQTMAFYSESVIESLKHIKIFDSVEDGIDFIINSFEQVNPK